MILNKDQRRFVESAIKPQIRTANDLQKLYRQTGINQATLKRITGISHVFLSKVVRQGALLLRVHGWACDYILAHPNINYANLKDAYDIMCYKRGCDLVKWRYNLGISIDKASVLLGKAYRNYWSIEQSRNVMHKSVCLAAMYLEEIWPQIKDEFNNKYSTATKIHKQVNLEGPLCHYQEMQTT